MGSIPYFTIYWHLCTDRIGIFLYLLLQYLKVWFVKCDTPCVTSIFIVYSATWVIPLHSLSLQAVFHTDLVPPRHSRSAIVVSRSWDTFVQSAWSMQHMQQCWWQWCCFHFDLNINPQGFYNYNISLCFLYLQTASLYFLSMLSYIVLSTNANH
jgi:hypothetical protein